ncbi:helix-turn-helix domain-containing protein [Myxococcota bacterium]|nr:helix-turn-helix domain-containing protein [Myxococcota bacterium]
MVANYHIPNAEGLNTNDASTWPSWLTLAEVALILRLSMSTLRWLVSSGKLKSRKFGRQRRVHKDVLTAYQSEG